MSLAREELWKALKDQNYMKIQEVIITNQGVEDLVNAKTSENTPLLQRVLMKNPLPMDLIRFIALHPDFNLHDQVSATCGSNLSSIFDLGSLEVFKLFEHLPGIIVLGEEIAFASVKKEINTTNQLLGKAKVAAKKLTDESKITRQAQKIADYAQKIENLSAMLLVLRDKTILKAIESDNPLLLEKLEAAGDAIREPLTDGTTPIYDLVTERKPNIDSWLTLQYELAMSKPSTTGVTTAGLFGAAAKKHADALAKKSTLVQEATAARVEIYTDAAHSLVDLHNEVLDGLGSKLRS